MRPNTPHVVFTPDHSICLGGHFYATSTLRETLYGTMHSFIAGDLTTNIEHTKDAFMLLSRMVAFFHHHLVDSGTSDADMDVDMGEPSFRLSV